MEPLEGPSLMAIAGLSYSLENFLNTLEHGPSEMVRLFVFLLLPSLFLKGFDPYDAELEKTNQSVVTIDNGLLRGGVTYPIMLEVKNIFEQSSTTTVLVSYLPLFWCLSC